MLTRPRTETIDLVAGALRGNVDPPPPGDYDITEVWNDRRGPSRFEIADDTKLTLPVAAEQPCTSKPVTAGIELLARQVTADGTVEIGLHNVSSGSICIAARVEAAGVQSDWMTIELDDAAGKQLRKLGFTAPWRAAVQVTVEPAPGRPPGRAGIWPSGPGARRRSPNGLMTAVVTYDSSRETGVFHGKLTTQLAVNVR